MDITTAIRALWASLWLLGLVYLVLFRTRRFVVDWFRDKMFDLRDELFDAASDGLISFDHPAYVTLRLTMNGYIRYCHRMSIYLIVFLTVFVPLPSSEPNPFLQRWCEAMTGLDDITRKKLEAYKTRMELLVVAYILLTGPILSAIVFTLFVFGDVIQSFDDFQRHMMSVMAEKIRSIELFRPHLDEIDEAAYNSGAAA